MDQCKEINARRAASNFVQAQKEVICTKLHTVINKSLCT